MSRAQSVRGMLNSARILGRAVARLSPRMLSYMGRRLARNKLAPRFPEAYQRRLARIAEALPPIGQPAHVGEGLEAVAHFYCEEYRHMLEDSLSGLLTMQGKTVNFGDPSAVDWAHRLPEEGDHQMWQVKLGHMGFICPMILEGDDRHHKAVKSYIESASAGVRPSDAGAFNGFWFPYGASHRILALGSALLISRARKALPKEVDAVAADFLKKNVAFVLDNIEHELENNHVERNLAAICLYLGHASHVSDVQKSKLASYISRLLDATILPDGSQIERSAMYQGLSVVSLGIMAETEWLPTELRERLAQAHEEGKRVLATLCHPDGQVALFNDAWHAEIPKWSGDPANDGRTLLPFGGYGRLSDHDDVCLLDAGALGPSWNPGHGHADFLSVEVSLAGNRLLVDPGTSGYNTGPDRARERSAEAHNGPIWVGYEPISFFGSFKVGRLTEAHLIEGSALPPNCMGGLFEDGPGVVGRIIQHLSGAGFLIADLWSPSSRQGQAGFLVPATWALQENAEGFILTQGREKARIAWISSAQSVVVEQSHWARHYGKLENAHRIVLQPTNDKTLSQNLVTWVGHSDPPPDAAQLGADMLRQLSSLNSAFEIGKLR